VDEKGRKMSKSEGNDIKGRSRAEGIFGAEHPPLWSAGDYQSDIPCSKELFKTIGEAYRKIRIHPLPAGQPLRLDIPRFEWS